MSIETIHHGIETGEKDHNPYSLSLPEATVLTRRLIQERQPIGRPSFACYQLKGEEAFADAARVIERHVFEKAFGNDAEEMLREYGPYEKESRFFLSVDTETGEPAGALRAIESAPGGAGFKTIRDLSAIDAILSEENIAKAHSVKDMAAVWDVGTVAVLPEYQSVRGHVSVQLFRALYLAAMKEQVEHFISVTDERAYKMLTRILKIPFVPLAGSKPIEYLGSSSSQAMYGHVPGFFDNMSQSISSVTSARAAVHDLVSGKHDGSIYL